MFEIPWITITLLTPILGALVLAFVPAEHATLHRHMTMIFMVLTFLFSLPMLGAFDPAVGTYQLTTSVENVPWIPALGANYHVGIDGISLFLVLLTTFLGPIVVLSGYHAIEDKVREYHVALLVLQTAMIGAFVSLDLLLFYVFWELMLIPMYLLVGIWGGQNRIYAAVKLFLYTMVGSVLMLVGIIYLYSQNPAGGFGIDAIIETGRSLSFVEQKWLFVAFAVAFLIKVPLFPFHTWLPDAHVQAPTAGSVILASILLKMGTYGLVRYAMPMMPDAVFWAAPTIGVLSVVGIIYGALVAYVQKDVKKLVAYSSVSHLGFVTLGLFAMTQASVAGAVYQSLAHGITTGGLFLCIGVIYERRHTRLLSEFGGLTKQIPLFAVFFIIIALASAGVPGLVGFVGEFLILAGSAQSYSLNFGKMSFFGDLPWGPDVTAYGFAAIAALGVILGALYILHMVQKMMFGPITNPENEHLEDLTGREIAYLLPMVLMCFVMGLFPNYFLSRINPSVDRFISDVEDNSVEFEEAVLDDYTRDADYLDWRKDGEAHSPWAVQAEHDSGHGAGHGGGHDAGHGEPNAGDHGASTGHSAPAPSGPAAPAGQNAAPAAGDGHEGHNH